MQHLFYVGDMMLGNIYSLNPTHIRRDIPTSIRLM